ncbi:unnamed protein product [Notodromas monacha]|uniref:Uncharacterized protein n=1 Tax=Notodromas monacha TaxID=399045 RepID=A0A7R9BIH0_9CRUS|nr:unnamed protein product [Notodromas monacha]CAG0914733.1 unnamed protein product [Notodromas monacha]
MNEAFRRWISFKGGGGGCGLCPCEGTSEAAMSCASFVGTNERTNQARVSLIGVFSSVQNSIPFPSLARKRWVREHRVDEQAMKVQCARRSSSSSSWSQTKRKEIKKSPRERVTISSCCAGVRFVVWCRAVVARRFPVRPAHMLNESCGCRLCGESATALRSQVWFGFGSTNTYHTLHSARQ